MLIHYLLVCESGLELFSGRASYTTFTTKNWEGDREMEQLGVMTSSCTRRRQDGIYCISPNVAKKSQEGLIRKKEQWESKLGGRRVWGSVWGLRSVQDLPRD